MKKTLPSLVLLFGMSLSVGMAASTITPKAATYDKTGTTTITDVVAGFTAPEQNSDKPVAPGTGNSDNPDTPTDNKGSESTALLKMAYISDFNFDSHNVSAKNETYNAKLIQTAQGKSITPFVQISDNRGLNSGWNLTVKQDSQFKTQDGKALKGAYVQFKAPFLQNMDGKDISSTIMPDEAKLTADGTSMPIITAQPGSGQGMTYGLFGTDQGDGTTDGTQMVVQGGTALAGQYKTTLTWALSSVPA